MADIAHELTETGAKTITLTRFELTNCCQDWPLICCCFADTYTQVAQIVTANNNCWFITCQQSGDSPGQCDHPFLTLVSVTLLCVKQPLTTPSYPPVAWPSLEIFSVKPTPLIWYDQHLPVWWTETLKSLSKQVPPQVQCQMGTWYPTQ